ncbi:hypothetical protein DC58_16725 [Vibrio navarrensis]|uniref:hypothetical protein n=1 Tax=Vibrio navarrensis TaxID=29495 RepID=UPI00052E0ED3|nr:hypothetical protein [Vibrio navarrensis]KGK21434.1 hypothetical protein DC58_16725 [Vibrio navarrensis]
MFGLIEIFNMSMQDQALLWTCPLIAGIASLIRGWTSELDLLKPPVYESVSTSTMEDKRKQTKESVRERGYWTMGMWLAGTGIGIGIAFLFLGAIQPTASAAGRLWFLSLILGYSTPLVLRNIDKKVEKALQKYNGSNS